MLEVIQKKLLALFQHKLEVLNKKPLALFQRKTEVLREGTRDDPENTATLLFQTPFFDT